jgi:sterol desaturase/sphingolipid hydroxylase (fatty acid hydroxylase superfamily)
MTGFIVGMYSLGKIIEALGEKLVGTALLGAVCVGLVLWICVYVRSRYHGYAVLGAVDVSELPLWRLAVYHTLNILLYWQVFYTTGLPYLIATGLFQAGITPADSSPWLWTFLFPISFGAVKPPNSWADIYSLGAAFIAGTIPFYMSSILTECFLVCRVLPEDRRPKDTYSLSDSMVCVIMAMLGMVSSKIWLVGWAGPLYTYIHDNFRITDSFTSEESAIGFWVCLITADFFFYVYHRTSHVMSWLWTAHSVHHSSEEFNLTLGPRESFMDWVTPTVLFSSTPMALFFPLPMMAATAQIRLAWQYWLHLVLWPATPTLEIVFNTPSTHRVHHAKNHDRLGKNFGAMFSIWDRIFGTFQPEYLDGQEGREDLYYGVVPATNSWDPLWINLQHWHHMFGKQMQWDSLASPFRHWTPPAGSCPKLGSRLNPVDKYSARPTSLTWSRYALVEGILMTVVCSIGVNTASYWDSSWLQAILRCNAATSDLILGFSALGVALWSSSCIGQIFTRESLFAFRYEVLRQLVVISCLAACMAPTTVATYALLRFAALCALWRAMPQAIDVHPEDSGNLSAEQGCAGAVTNLENSFKEWGVAQL